MTLLESVIAFVVLALVGVVCLEQISEAAHLQQRTVAWSQAIPTADAALAAALVSAPPLADASARPSTADPSASTAVTRRRPWRPGLDVVEVTVPVATGGSLTVSHLVPAVDRRVP